MALLQYHAWQHLGSPYTLCAPGQDLASTLRAHGLEVEHYPDESHLTATIAEDHCPFSQTPWPGIQPYGYGMAVDILGSGLVALAARLVADKQAGVPGTAPIKYINWTDSQGNCWHDSWQPGHARRSSTDRGHVHISFRTDYVTSSAMAGYDPLAPGPTPLGDDVPRILRTETGAFYLTTGSDLHPIATGDELTRLEFVWSLPVAARIAVTNADVAHGDYGRLPSDDHGQPIDLAAVEAAAEKGAKEGIDGATIHAAS